MNRNTTVGELSVLTMNELDRRFDYVLNPMHQPDNQFDQPFQPIYGTATFFEPGFRLVLSSQKLVLYQNVLNQIKCELLGIINIKSNTSR